MWEYETFRLTSYYVQLFAKLIELLDGGQTRLTASWIPDICSKSDRQYKSRSRPDSPDRPPCVETFSKKEIINQQTSGVWDIKKYPLSLNFFFISYSWLSPPEERPDPTLPVLTMDSASPTCLRSVISLVFRRFCLSDNVNPRVVVPLMTANCYWRGSEELESRFRWR